MAAQSPTWYIAVPQSGHRNFERALASSTWGAKRRSQFVDETGREIQSGDTVHFVLSPRWAGDGPTPVGFPRVSLDRYDIDADVVVVRVASNVFEGQDAVWDDDLYPWRFRFSVIDRKNKMHLGPGLVDDAIRDAVRKSLIAQGKAISLSVPESSNFLSSLILEVLNRYSDARREPFPTHDVAETVKRTVPQVLHQVVDLPKDRYIVLSSVGQGNWAAVPWVAILDQQRGGNIQNGLYVAILFPADMSKVVLALMYGVTGSGGREGRTRGSIDNRVTTLRKRLHLGGTTWRLEPIQLSDHGVGAQYGRGIVCYQTFEKDSLPSDAEWRTVVDELLDLYDDAFDAMSGAPNYEFDDSETELTAKEEHESYGVTPFSLSDAHNLVASLGYRMSADMLLNLILSLYVRPFVILSGRSGTGKTTISRILAGLFGWDYHLVAVSPAWADPADLLGFVSPMNHARVAGALETLLTAQTSSALVCLDEFNVAKVEHYFSDFISAMDGGDEFRFWGGMAGLERLVRDSHDALKLPDNLYVVATMNFDDSVQSITPRVLDRANLIEFDVATAEDLVVDQRLDWETLKDHTTFAWPWVDSIETDDELAHAAIQRVWRSLEGSRGQFGHRVAQEMYRYVVAGMPFGDELARTEGQQREALLDRQMVQRLLPKFHGTAATRDIDALAKLLQNLLGQEEKPPEVQERQRLVDEATNLGVYPLTVAKIRRLLATFTEDGYASFW